MEILIRIVAQMFLGSILSKITSILFIALAAFLGYGYFVDPKMLATLIESVKAFFGAGGSATAVTAAKTLL
jgi:hypothetical protein